ncbi:MAG: hypothetical protein K0U74_03210 [Alphaproteobacteria bacterium]|nr:hypothetical protein [Alphaproteobacteria bacterium]
MLYDALEWETASAKKTADAYRHYLAVKSDGRFTEDARIALAELESWPTAVRADCSDPKYLRYHIQKFPNGRFSDIARRIAFDIDQFYLAFAEGTPEAYEKYLSDFPGGRCQQRANELLHNALGTPSKPIGDIDDDDANAVIIHKDVIYLLGSTTRRGFRRPWAVPLRKDLERIHSKLGGYSNGADLPSFWDSLYYKLGLADVTGSIHCGVSNSNNIVLAEVITRQSNFGTFQRTEIVVLDQNSVRRKWLRIDGFSPSGPKCLTLLENGNFLLTGYLAEKSDELAHMVVFSPGGQIISSFSYRGPYRRSRYITAAPISHGKILVSGSGLLSNGRLEGFLRVVNNEGHQLNRSALILDSGKVASNISKTKDGLMIVSGSRSIAQRQFGGGFIQLRDEGLALENECIVPEARIDAALETLTNRITAIGQSKRGGGTRIYTKTFDKRCNVYGWRELPISSGSNVIGSGDEILTDAIPVIGGRIGLVGVTTVGGAGKTDALIRFTKPHQPPPTPERFFAGSRTLPLSRLEFAAQGFSASSGTKDRRAVSKKVPLPARSPRRVVGLRKSREPEPAVNSWSLSVSRTKQPY